MTAHTVMALQAVNFLDLGLIAKGVDGARWSHPGLDGFHLANETLAGEGRDLPVRCWPKYRALDFAGARQDANDPSSSFLQ